MQVEINTERPDLIISLLAINGEGHDIANDDAMKGHDLPYVQDDATQMVWDRWEANYRDLVILDGDNQPVDAFNLTVRDLSESYVYEELKTLLIEAAEADADAQSK